MLTASGNFTGIMLYYIINLSSSFYSCRWLLTFEGLFFFESSFFLKHIPGTNQAICIYAKQWPSYCICLMIAVQRETRSNRSSHHPSYYYYYYIYMYIYIYIYIYTCILPWQHAPWLRRPWCHGWTQDPQLRPSLLPSFPTMTNELYDILNDIFQYKEKH